MHCPNCGAEIKDSDQEFCENCGKDLSSRLKPGEQAEENSSDYMDDIKARIPVNKKEIKEEIAKVKERTKAEKERLKEEMARERERAKHEKERVKEKLARDKEKLREERERIKEESRERKEKLREERERMREDNRERKERLRDTKKEFVRLNFTLPKEMKDDLKELAEDLSKSVSQFIRDAVISYKDEILGKIGIPKTPKSPKSPKPPKSPEPPKFKVVSRDTERDLLKKKKRVEGIIKLQKCLPIEKLAQALNITLEDAENFIYELAGAGIGGSFEEGVFKYTNDDEEVKKALFDLIEEM